MTDKIRHSPTSEGNSQHQSTSAEGSVLNKGINTHQVENILGYHCPNRRNDLENPSAPDKMESKTDTGESQDSQIKHHQTEEAGNHNSTEE